MAMYNNYTQINRNEDTYECHVCFAVVRDRSAHTDSHTLNPGISVVRDRSAHTDSHTLNPGISVVREHYLYCPVCAARCMVYRDGAAILRYYPHRNVSRNEDFCASSYKRTDGEKS